MRQFVVVRRKAASTNVFGPFDSAITAATWAKRQWPDDSGFATRGSSTWFVVRLANPAATFITGTKAS